MSWKNNDHKKNFNSKRKPFAKKDEHYLDKFKGRAIEEERKEWNEGENRRRRKSK